jgi:hypothetical protein
VLKEAKDSFLFCRIVYFVNLFALTDLLSHWETAFSPAMLLLFPIVTVGSSIPPQEGRIHQRDREAWSVSTETTEAGIVQVRSAYCTSCPPTTRNAVKNRSKQMAEAQRYDAAPPASWRVQTRALKGVTLGPRIIEAGW